MSEKIKRYELCEDVEAYDQGYGTIVLYGGGVSEAVCFSSDVTALESELEKVKAERGRAVELLESVDSDITICRDGFSMGDSLYDSLMNITDGIHDFLASLNNEEEEK